MSIFVGPSTGFSLQNIFGQQLVGQYEMNDLTGVIKDSSNKASVWLDRSQGMQLGNELCVNADFSTDTWWTKDVGVTINSGSAHFINVSNGLGIYKACLTVGKVYNVTFEVKNYISGSLRVGLGANLIKTGITSNGVYTCCGQCTVNSNMIIYTEFVNVTADIDNVSIKEILGNHLSQSNVSFSPSVIPYLETDTIFGAELCVNGGFDINGDGFGGAGGTTNWNAEGSLTMTATLSNGDIRLISNTQILAPNTMYVLKFRGKSSNSTVKFQTSIYYSENTYVIKNPNLTTTYQDYEFIFSKSNLYLYINFAINNGQEFTIDDLSCKEIVSYTKSELIFDGANDFLKTLQISSWINPITYYVILNQRTWKYNSSIFEGYTSSTNLLYQYYNNSQLSTYNGSNVVANGNVAIDTYNLIKVTFNGTQSIFRLNDNTEVIGNAGNGNPQGLSLGARESNNTISSTNISIPAMFVIKGTPSLAQYMAMMSYIKRTYGV